MSACLCIILCSAVGFTFKFSMIMWRTLIFVATVFVQFTAVQKTFHRMKFHWSSNEGLTKVRFFDRNNLKSRKFLHYSWFDSANFLPFPSSSNLLNLHDLSFHPIKNFSRNASGIPQKIVFYLISLQLIWFETISPELTRASS